MKTQKLLSVIAFLFLTTSIFSQENKEDTKESNKIDYEKLKETFLETLKEAQKEKEEVVGTFKIRKGYIEIHGENENPLDIVEKDNKIKRILEKPSISLLTKKEKEELFKLFTKDVDSIEKKKLSIINSIASIDSNKIKEKEILLKELEGTILQIDKIKKEAEKRVSKIDIGDVYLNKDTLRTTLSEKGKWKVSRVNIEIYEGFINDILVTLVEDTESKVKVPRERYFSNRVPTSLMSYNGYQSNFLYEKYKNKKENETKIKLTDVLDYQHKMGKNFVPSNQTIEITKDRESFDVKLKTNLNALLDFRIYSDFLGVINETPNGLINFEASSKIFLYPKNNQRKHYFKSITPFLRYSRFDNDDRSVEIKQDSTVNRKLDLVQKPFLQMGVELSLFEFKSKELPYTFKIPIRMQVNVSESDTIPNILDERKTINTLVYGIGLYANMKRTKNFGFNLGIDYEWYDQKANSDNIKRVSIFNTIGAGAELYYFKSEDSNDAFYLRLQTRRIIDVPENFVSVQFGYKASLNLTSKK